MFAVGSTYIYTCRNVITDEHIVNYIIAKFYLPPLLIISIDIIVVKNNYIKNKVVNANPNLQQWPLIAYRKAANIVTQHPNSKKLIQKKKKND